MLSLRTTTSSLTSSKLSHTFTTTKQLKLPTRLSSQTLKLPTRLSSQRLKMSNTTTSKNQTIEHIVLFKVKPDTDTTKLNSMLNGLNGLVSLDSVLHLKAGALLRTRSHPTLNFTHMLHSRYSSKDNLSAYSSHPDHMRVVKENVLPICDDIMAVDWVADDIGGPITPRAGSALRVTFLKVKEDVGDHGKGEILEVVKGLKEKFGGIVQLSCGENFSPTRAKGFGIVSLAVFDGVSELESVVEDELVGMEKDKVRKYLDSVLVVDYVVPADVGAAQPANL